MNRTPTEWAKFFRANKVFEVAIQMVGDLVGYPKKSTHRSEDIETLRHAVEGAMLVAVERHRPWRLLEQDKFPEETWIEVAGDSGYVGNPTGRGQSCQWFCVIAKYDKSFRPRSPWIDVTGTCLGDYGWLPLLWRPAEFPNGLPENYT